MTSWLHRQIQVSWWPCRRIFLVSFLLNFSPHIQPALTDKFWRSIRTLYSLFLWCKYMRLSGSCWFCFLRWGLYESYPLKPPFVGVNRILKILKLWFYQNCFSNFNQILRSDQDVQVLFVCCPEIRPTNPRWRAAAILKTVKRGIPATVWLIWHMHCRLYI